MFKPRRRRTKVDEDNEPIATKITATEVIVTKEEKKDENPRETPRKLYGRAKYTKGGTIEKLATEVVTKVEEPVKHPTYKTKKYKILSQVEPISSVKNEETNKTYSRNRTFNRRGVQSNTEDNNISKDESNKNEIPEKTEKYSRRSRYNKTKDENENVPSKSTETIITKKIETVKPKENETEVVMTKIETTTSMAKEIGEKQPSEDGSASKKRIFFHRREEPDKNIEKIPIVNNVKQEIIINQKELVERKPLIIKETKIEMEDDKKPKDGMVLIKTEVVEVREIKDGKPEIRKTKEAKRIIEEKPVVEENIISTEKKEEMPTYNAKLSEIKEENEESPFRGEKSPSKKIIGINDIQKVKIEKVEINEIDEKNKKKIPEVREFKVKNEIKEDKKPIVQEIKIKKEIIKEERPIFNDIEKVTITKGKIQEKTRENEIITKKQKNIVGGEESPNKEDSLKSTLNQVEEINMDKFISTPSFIREVLDIVVKENIEFKDKIFFPNADDIKDNYKDFDKKTISHRFSDIDLDELMAYNPSIEELLKKYTLKAERINVSNN